MAAESRTAVLAALAGNGLLVLLKALAAAFTGSAAMLAETFHSLADTGNQALLALGMRLARLPPHDRHPFGHGKNVYFWSFVVSLMLFSLGGAFAIWEGVRQLLHPAPHESFRWAWGVLAGSFVFESGSFTVAVRALGRVKGRRGIWEYVRETRDPTLPTVLLEDSAALVSILIAGLGIALTQWTGRTLWDAIASGCIGLILLAVAIFLAFETYSLLLGENAPPAVEAEIRRVVEADRAVARMVALRTMHLGPASVLVSVDVKFRDELTTAEIETAVSRLQAAIGRARGVATNAGLVIIEPAAPESRRIDAAA